ncbi:hypothetical protein LguiB_001566 [Lonicera macranthoides]
MVESRLGPNTKVVEGKEMKTWPKTENVAKNGESFGAWMKKLWSSKAELNKPDAKNGLVESGVPTNENKSSGSPSTEKQKHHYLRLQEIILNDIKSTHDLELITLMRFRRLKPPNRIRGIIKDSQDYAEVCFQESGDRVKHWITLNEPWSFSYGEYALGTMAPVRGYFPKMPTRSKRYVQHLLPPSLFSFLVVARIKSSARIGDPGTEPYVVSHHQLLAHAYAVQLYRSHKSEFRAKSYGGNTNSAPDPKVLKHRPALMVHRVDLALVATYPGPARGTARCAIPCTSRLSTGGPSLGVTPGDIGANGRDNLRKRPKELIKDFVNGHSQGKPHLLSHFSHFPIILTSIKPTAAYRTVINRVPEGVSWCSLSVVSWKLLWVFSLLTIQSVVPGKVTVAWVSPNDFLGEPSPCATNHPEETWKRTLDPSGLTGFIVLGLWVTEATLISPWNGISPKLRCIAWFSISGGTWFTNLEAFDGTAFRGILSISRYGTQIEGFVCLRILYYMLKS